MLKFLWEEKEEKGQSVSQNVSKQASYERNFTTLKSMRILSRLTRLAFQLLVFMSLL